MRHIRGAVCRAGLALAWSAATAGAQSTSVRLLPPPEFPEASVQANGPSEQPVARPFIPPPNLPSPPRALSQRTADPADPLVVQGVLSLPRLVDAVVALHPTRQAALAACQAAAQRTPQAVALDDPMFAVMVGPGAWGSEFDGAYMVEASQKIPWPGKRALRGQIARAEVSAACLDVEDAALMLAEAAKAAFLDYYLVHRDLELNQESARIMREFRATASAKYQTNQVTQQDVLQADVDLTEITRRRFELERMERVAVARINTLLDRAADTPLPPPPGQLPTPDDIPPPSHLLQWAVDRRPDLAAQGARIRAEQASLALAQREFYPDPEIVGRYDAFWQEDPLRAAVGVNVNLPIYKEKRRAAAREAMFRLQREQWELERKLADLRNDVYSTHARLLEARRSIELYRTVLLPLARQNVDAATSGYVAATVDFLRLLEAQRQYILLRERSYEAETDLHRRLAELERVTGGPLPGLGVPEELPPTEPEA